MSDTPEPEAPEIIDLDTLKDAPVLATRERQLPVQLTDDELATRVDQQSEMWAVMRDLKEAEDERRKVFNRQHKAREDEFDKGQRIVKAKAEHRQVVVKVYALLDGPPDSNAAITVRTDTGEVRDRRALTPTELDKLAQQALPLAGADAEEGAAEAPPEPLPKGARDLVVAIKAGRADHSLDALDADSRTIVIKALVARRVVLAALELPPEAGEPAGDS